MCSVTCSVQSLRLLLVLSFVQLVVKFLTFYGIREYIVVFTRIRFEPYPAVVASSPPSDTMFLQHAF
jgi:hypothetical protein